MINLRDAQLIKPKKLTFEVITPIVTRRYGNDTVGMLSGASIRGLLRWWYRVIALSMQNGSRLAGYECLIFGSPGKIATPVEIHVDLSKATWGRPHLKEPYWRRFRLKNYQGDLIIGGEISVWLVPNPKRLADDGLREIIEHSMRIYESLLEVISLIGGIGAAWRRGMGSIMLKDHLNIRREKYGKETKEAINAVKRNIGYLISQYKDILNVRYDLGKDVKLSIKGKDKKGKKIDKSIPIQGIIKFPILDINNIISNINAIELCEKCSWDILNKTYRFLKRQYLQDFVNIFKREEKEILGKPENEKYAWLFRERLTYGLPTKITRRGYKITVKDENEEGRFPSRYILTIKKIEGKYCKITYSFRTI